MDSDDTREIRRNIRKVLDDDQPATGYRFLVGRFLEAIEHGIVAALRRYTGPDFVDSGDLQSKALNTFLDKRLPDKTFLQHLLQSETPEAYVVTSAQNITIDELRKLPDVDLPSDPVVDPAEVEHVVHEAELSQELLDELADLPREDFLLLAVASAEGAAHLELSTADMERLANGRGVDVQQVRQELAARRGTQEARRAELDHTIQKRLRRMLSAERQTRRAWSAIRHIDGERAEPDAQVPQPLIDSMRESYTALERATAGQRSAFLQRYEELRERLATLQRKERRQRARDLPAGPRYVEILRILGPWPAEDDPQALGRAINSLTIRLRRLRRRLRARCGGQDD